MRFAYSIAFYLATPFILLHFAIRGIKDRRYLQRWKERFAIFDATKCGGGIVIHAASVGELNAALPLIEALRNSTGPGPVLISTFTPTGSAKARTLTGPGLCHCYAPLDLPGAVRRFFEAFRPRLLVILETEIWPNLYAEARRRKIPVMMVNARLSDRSMRGYRRFSSLISGTLASVDHIAAQSRHDAERLVACGADPNKVSVSGNLKFDLQVPPDIEEQASETRCRWGEGRPVLIAGSTHEADDIVVLDAFGTVLHSFPDALLILVPRHPERFTEAEKLAKESGLRTWSLGKGRELPTETQCLVVDAMGELLNHYACSDVAVIGGSFGATGGHNPLEACALARPVLFGPNMMNFREIADALLDSGAAAQVQDASQLAERTVALLGDPRKRQASGSAGKNLVDQGRGAVQEILAVVARLSG